MIVFYRFLKFMYQTTQFWKSQNKSCLDTQRWRFCRTQYYTYFGGLLCNVLQNSILTDFQTFNTFWLKSACSDVTKSIKFKKFRPVTFRFSQVSIDSRKGARNGGASRPCLWLFNILGGWRRFSPRSQSRVNKSWFRGWNLLICVFHVFRDALLDLKTSKEK